MSALTRNRAGLLFAALVVAALLLPAASARAQSQVTTFWPVFDYRSSATGELASLQLFGPLFKYSRRGTESLFSIRPLYSRVYDRRNEIGRSEFLYPLATKKDTPTLTYFTVLRLLVHDFGAREEGGRNEFTLFPFLFYGNHSEAGKYFAFFPFGGVIKEKYGKDRISFALFPLYSRTLTDGVISENYLWPIFNRTHGAAEGWRVWPFYGYHRQGEDVFSHFILWPFYFAADRGMTGPAPSRLRMLFPFYIHRESTGYSSTTWLWPFTKFVDNRRKDYKEYTLLWPLIRFARGGERDGFRLLPFYMNERIGDFHKRWYLWPLWKVEEIRSAEINRYRLRLLYFLYSNLTETVPDQELPRRRRIDLWPLFTWEMKRGVTRFHTLSLLEPFFPENDEIERNWAPLYRIYQVRSDRQGNEISSFLWNLYWKERRGDDLAVELFPFIFYRSEKFDRSLEFSVLKGLIRYRKDDRLHRLNLLWLPWGMTWFDTSEKTAG